MDSSMLGLVLLLGIFLIIVFHEQIIAFFQYFIWRRKIEDIHDYDDEMIRDVLLDISDKAFDLSGEDIPYGRAKWFLVGDENFCSDIDTALVEYYGFSPVRSKTELDFHEYGVLLTQNGIYSSKQCGEKSKEGKYNSTSSFYPFEGLWKVKYDGEKSQIKFYYKNGVIKKLDLSIEANRIEAMVRGLSKIIKSGYTYDLQTNYIAEKIKAEVDRTRGISLSDDIIATRIGALGAVYANLPEHFTGELLNSIVNNPQGHGFAAEYANNLVDQVKNPFLHVERIGQNNAKNGADRVVGDVNIQTKYLSSARNSVNAAFDSKQNGGMYRYEGMQLEVPKDQYLEAIEVMKQRITEGKVPGVTNPEDAKNIIRKGSVTWKEAKLIAEGGNITSLKYDALDGVITTLPAASICFVIMFAQAKWAGVDTKEAAVSAAKAGATSLCLGTVVYTGSQQFAKMFTQQIAAKTGKKIAANTVAKGAGLGISIGIVMAPNVFNALIGRISRQQLLKNTAVAGGGFAAGVASSAGAGAALGSVVPGAGNVAGAVVGATAGIIGGIAGSALTKKIVDKFIEDDRVEMFAILKEEYIDVVMSISLSQDEFSEIQELIFDKGLENKLKSMFQAGKKDKTRIYAREHIVEKAVNKVIKKRKIVSDVELVEGIDYVVYDV